MEPDRPKVNEVLEDYEFGEDEALDLAKISLDTLLGTSSDRELVANAILASASLAQKYISDALSPNQGARRFVLFEELFSGGFGDFFPSLRVVSPFGIKGEVQFTDVKKERVIKYVEEKFREVVSKYGLADAESLDDLKVVEAGWNEALPSPINGLIAVYKLVNALREAGVFVSHADFLGLTQRVVPGETPTIYLSVDGTRGLPGLDLKIRYDCHVTEVPFDNPFDFFSYDLRPVYPKPARYLIKNVVLLQLLDYLFGYSYGASKLSPAPLHHSVEEDDLHKLYFEGPVSRSSIDEFFSRVVSPEEVASALKSLQGVPDASVGEEEVELFKKFLSESGVLKFLANIAKAYLSRNELPVFLASLDIVPAVSFVAALGSISAKLPESKTPLQAISGKQKIPFSEVRGTYYKSVELLARTLGGANASTLPERISGLLRSGLSLAYASDAKLRNQVPVKVSEHFRNVSSRVIAARLAEGADAFYIAFQPSFTKTAYAGVYETQLKRGGGSNVVYVVNLNPKYFLDKSITSGVDFSTLVYSILYHEFLHIYLRHTGVDVLSKSKAFGDTRILMVSQLEGVPEQLTSLVPENISNLHTDAIINSVSLQMANYVSLAQAFIARRKRGTINPTAVVERMRRLLSSGFFVNHAIGEFGDPESFLPSLVVLEASSSSFARLRITSPGDKDYRETFKNVANLRHFSFYLPSFKIPREHELSDPLFFDNAQGIHPGADGAVSLLAMCAILAAEGLASSQGGSPRRDKTGPQI